jgi:hypothetical protein
VAPEEQGLDAGAWALAHQDYRGRWEGVHERQLTPVARVDAEPACGYRRKMRRGGEQAAGLGFARASLMTLSLATALSGGLGGCRFDTGGLALPGEVLDAAMGPADASVDGGICVPGQRQCSSAGTLSYCRGGQLVTEACADGCLTEPSPHCRGIDPSNGVELGMLAGATQDLEIPGNERWVFATESGAIFNCAAGTFMRAAGEGVSGGIGYYRVDNGDGGVGLGLFALRGLRVRGGGEVVAVGALGLGLLVQGEARFDDGLVASGGPAGCSIESACGSQKGAISCAGPGGFAGGSANQNGQGLGGGTHGSGSDAAGQFEGGGGGAGHATAGAPGGGDFGGAAGVTYGASDCEPIFGGAGGGGGGQDVTGLGALGGGGGGAVQITALGKISVGGGAQLVVGGGGGAAGSPSGGAGGGGAGGVLLLEAPMLKIDGDLAANGGGGGAGAGSVADLQPETPGAPGGVGITPAPGGTGLYNGGNGGAGATLPTAGGNPGPIDGTAGGGGAVGRVCLRSVPGGVGMGNLGVSPAPKILEDLIR